VKDNGNEDRFSQSWRGGSSRPGHHFRTSLDHMRIALIHALRHSPPPIESAFARLWPEAELVNLLDDSLSADLAKDGRLTSHMTERFLALTRYAISAGAEGVLFTCSAFGPCIEACVKTFPAIPILKPNEAMIEETARFGGRIGLLATFKATLTTMPGEFPAGTDLVVRQIEGALPALDRGDTAEHDRLTVKAALELDDCKVFALAQFSLARAAQAVASATGKPVLTTPDTAVRKLKSLFSLSSERQ
jgi:hypothetical protein